MPANRKLFVNIPVEDVARSVEFFTALGLELDPRFTGEQSAMLVVGEDAFVMLLSHDHFGQFTTRDIADAHAATEAIISLSADSREAVDDFADTALASGGSKANEPMDHGFMYGRSFHDPDGHLWEVMWMDMAAFEEQQAAAASV